MQGKRRNDGRGIVFKLKEGRIQIGLQAFAFVVCIALVGCATPNSAPLSSSAVPVTGNPGGSIQVHEYSLIEQSADNPNHIEFQERVPVAVAARRAGWLFNRQEDAILAQNQALAAFGYRMASNPTPPFSGYALYHNGELIQRDVAQFWLVSLERAKDDEGWGGFLLIFETLDGERRVASPEGIRPWSGQDQTTVGSLPVDQDNRVAYAESVGSEVSVKTNPELLSSGAGESLSKAGNESIFGRQVIAGEPFYFFQRGGLIHLHYAGRNLAYKYDQVVHNNTGETAIFNPGGTGQITWFYALRDGVWYYVEFGVFR